MVLPASGQISFYDINIELGRGGNATIGLDEAENGTYATINKCASPFPGSSNPAIITEWYSYNHTAASTLIGYFDYSATSCAAACALAFDCSAALYYNAANTAVHPNSLCSTFPNVGYYAICDRSTCYDVGSSGVVNGTTACSTTTTTTTTTAGCSGLGASCPENDGEFSPTCCSGNCCSGVCTSTAC
jgi:hypothetical protein